MTSSAAVTYALGHGTFNDFVLILDPEGDVTLSPKTVARLCDRNGQFGADGLIRVIRSSALPEGSDQPGTTWFMDYRNADGSIAQMCGNGIRVFAHYLQVMGLQELPDEAAVDSGSATAVWVGSRSGPVRVSLRGSDIVARLGAWHVIDEAIAVEAAEGTSPRVQGTRISTGNPHVVSLLDAGGVQQLNLTQIPMLDPAPAEGANIEFMEFLDAPGPDTGHVRMRVYERGVGETQSCGSGAVATAVAASLHVRQQPGNAGSGIRRWWIDVPGGRLTITLPEAGQRSGDWADLAGAAVITAHGEFTAQEWAAWTGSA